MVFLKSWSGSIFIRIISNKFTTKFFFYFLQACNHENKDQVCSIKCCIEFPYFLVQMLLLCIITLLIPILLRSSNSQPFSASLLSLLISLISSFNLLHLSSSLMIVVYSSWLMSESINAWDISVSILFNLLLASIAILLCFLLFLVVFNVFFYDSCS